MKTDTDRSIESWNLLYHAFDCFKAGDEEGLERAVGRMERMEGLKKYDRFQAIEVRH